MLRYLLPALLLLATPALAQRFIKGRITDSTTHAGIQRASIYTTNGKIFISGDSGIFYLHMDSSEKTFTIVYPGYRIRTITLNESNYYEVLLCAHTDLFAGKISASRLTIGSFDLEPRKMIRHNNYEGWRLGVVFSTNNKLSRHFSLNGGYAYGFGDKGHKYAAGITLRIKPQDSFNVKLNYTYDVAEPGEIMFRQYRLLNTEPYRQANLSDMDKFTNITGAISFKGIKYLETELFISMIERRVTSDYTFSDENINVFNATETGIALKYAYGEGRENIAKHANWPEFYIEVKKGLKHLGGDFDYMRYDLKVLYKLDLGGVGISRFQLRAGRITGELPVSFLYNMRANFGNRFSFYSINSFETMRMSEFFSDRYVALNYVHNIGKLFLKKKKISPEFSLVSNAAFGDLENVSPHRNISFKKMNKGYYESGMVFVIDIKGMAAIVGMGGFFRYGPYTLPVFRQNLSGKFYVLLRI